MGTKMNEELPIAGRAGDLGRHRADEPKAEGLGSYDNAGYGLAPQLGVADYSTFAHPGLTDLELGFDHQDLLGFFIRHPAECGKNRYQ